MGSAARFWPTRLFKLGARNDASPEFVPRTEIAARIIGKKVAEPAAELKVTSTGQESTAVTSLDDLTQAVDLPPATLPADDADLSRQADRFLPDKTSTTLTDKRGRVIRARIINLSATGVAIEADFRAMPADSVTTVGSKPVRPGRTIRGGQVFVFDKPLDPARCNKQVVL